MIDQKNIVLSGAQIYLENSVISNGSVEVSRGKITKVSKGVIREGPEAIPLSSEHKILPGRIDLHIHGTHGVDIMDATPEALDVMIKNLPKEGTTSFLATTVTMPQEKIEAALVNIAKMTKYSGAEILGIHLEGPFISPKKAGSHKVSNILAPDIQLFERWQRLANNQIKLVTIAPEIPGGLDFIEYLSSERVVVSIGHTHATYQEAMLGIEKGCRHATHLYNAMTGLDHREPGVALAVLEQPILAELIADGIHVSPEMLRFAFHIKSKERLCLVTDSMRAKCMGDGEFELGQQKVFVKNKQARLRDGTLAGSILTMDEACQNMLAFGVCDLFELMYLTAINPAKQISAFDAKGSIAVGKDADIIVLDKNNNLCLTICNGEIAYQA